jgi:BirA family biotin operon repressor/biotin-[acetyl-CoA-carboxylase] ligase
MKRAPDPLARRVFVALSDARLHSGAQLATRLGVSRTAIWKAVGELRALGLDITSNPRHGYQLPVAITPLRAATIRRLLAPDIRDVLRHGAVSWSLPSTNATLLATAAPEPGQSDFLLTENQTAGRGRRGRSWLAAPGATLCLSVSWTFAALPPNAGALSLAIGVAVRRALRTLDLQRVELKWPNDLVHQQRKLGGILLELRAEAAGPAMVIVGVGLNVNASPRLATRVRASGTESIALASMCPMAIDRNQLSAAVISEIWRVLATFAESGFASFAEEWRGADALRGRAVTVSGLDAEIIGTATGIDDDGALRVETRDGLQRISSGDVSVRSQA